MLLEMIRLLCLAAALIAPMPLAHADEPRRLRFAVEWGPVPLAEVEFVLARGDGLTALDGSARTVGAADLFAGMAVTQSIRYSPPAKALYISLWDDGDGSARQRIVAWDGGTPVRIEAPPPEEELTPIPEGELEGTVDPAFPWLDTIARLDAGGRCTGAYRVFDGVRRLDLTLTDLGAAMLEDDRGWTYSGPAVACGLEMRRVGGFPPERDVAESDYDRVMWFARVGGAHMPVRLSVEWPLGYATARIDLR